MNFKIEIKYTEPNENSNFPTIDISCNEAPEFLQFEYSNMRNLYEGNRCGHGIQVNDFDLEEKLKEACAKIADIIYKFRDELKK